MNAPIFYVVALSEIGVSFTTISLSEYDDNYFDGDGENIFIFRAFEFLKL